MDIFTIEPHEKLRPVIKRFWYAKIKKSKTIYRILADGAPGLIVQHNEGHSALFNPTIDSYLPVQFVYGQGTEPHINCFTEDACVFGINFQPTALKRLFSIDASEITNSLIATEHLFSRDFSERILNTHDPKQIVQLLSEQLYIKMLRSQQNTMIGQSVNLLIEKTEELNSKTLSTQFSISRRQFQRKFKEQVGVSPETYLRITKFQKSIHLLLRSQEEKLSNIAYALNYADQSHFCREFKYFSGHTPKHFWNAMRKITPLSVSNSTQFEPIRVVSIEE